MATFDRACSDRAALDRSRGLACAVTLAALSMIAPIAAAADPVADFYRGKQMQMVIPSTAGGDYDNRARLVSRHMGRHIPGEPNIVPRNMPGGAGVTGANYIATVAPRDGTVLHALLQNMPLHQAVGGQGTEFDVLAFAWIGNTTATPNLISAWHTTGVTHITDVFNKELTVGAPTGTSAAVYPRALNMLTATKFKIIAGYPGGNDVNFAMERGEVGGRGSNSWAAWKSTRPHWLAEKKIFHLVQIGLERHPELPDVPLMFELARSPQDREVLRFLSADVAISRAIVATPGIPPDRVAALRRAFEATMKDAAFLAEAAKSGMDISPTTGEAARKVAVEILGASDAVKKKAKEIIDSK
jgi:tripartite-type tricarboxylate transporter receptor subunit TctC